MNFRWGFVGIMWQVNPEYKKHLRYENVNKVLYLLVIRVICGCIESAFLWYKLFFTTLKTLGFDINPYDRCVANKMIEGTYFTISLCVNENELLHKTHQ